MNMVFGFPFGRRLLDTPTDDDPNTPPLARDGDSDADGDGAADALPFQHPKLPPRTSPHDVMTNDGKLRLPALDIGVCARCSAVCTSLLEQIRHEYTTHRFIDAGLVRRADGSALTCYPCPLCGIGTGVVFPTVHEYCQHIKLHLDTPSTADGVDIITYPMGADLSSKTSTHPAPELDTTLNVSTTTHAILHPSHVANDAMDGVGDMDTEADVEPPRREGDVIGHGVPTTTREETTPTHAESASNSSVQPAPTDTGVSTEADVPAGTTTHDVHNTHDSLPATISPRVQSQPASDTATPLVQHTTTTARLAPNDHDGVIEPDGATTTSETSETRMDTHPPRVSTDALTTHVPTEAVVTTVPTNVLTAAPTELSMQAPTMNTPTGVSMDNALVEASAEMMTQSSTQAPTTDDVSIRGTD